MGRTIARKIEAMLNESIIPEKQFFVSLQGSDSSNGSKNSPFKSIKAAQSAVRKFLKEKRNVPIEVIIAGGKYEMKETLTFTEEDSGTVRAPVTYRAADNEKAELFGGRIITGWIKVKDNHWMVKMPDVKSGDWYFRQLFVDGTRLQRARTPDSGYWKPAGRLSRYSFARKYGTKQTPSYLACKFGFRYHSLPAWEDWSDVEMHMYHSWEASWHRIWKIDPQRKDIYFQSPSRYPITWFAERYYFENFAEAMNLPGEWYLSSNKGELHYLAADNEDPRDREFVAPGIVKFMTILGNKDKKKVSNLRFRGLNFKCSQVEMGRGNFGKQELEQTRAEVFKDFPENPAPGYTDSQAAPLCGEAVLIEDAMNINFDSCRFNNTGGYAINISRRCRNVIVNGCEMYDLAGGGVLLGMTEPWVKRDGIPYSDSPHHNRISNCLIHSCGQFFPASVGIWIAQAHHNTVEHNEISDLSYSGVSTGWNWGRKETGYTHDNWLAKNYVHDVARNLGDAAGFYSVGMTPDCTYFENYIDRIFKGRGTHGVVDAIGFDDGGKGWRVERNVVGKINGKYTSFNRNGPADHTWIQNSFSTGSSRSTTLPHDAKLEPDQFTMGVEFMLSNYPTGKKNRRWLLCKNGHEYNNANYSLLVHGRKAAAYMNIGDTKNNLHVLTSTVDLEEVTANYVIMSYDGKTLRLYVNGKPAGEKFIGKSRTKGTGPLVFGRRTDGYGQFINGVRKAFIYNKVLSPSAILEITEDAGKPLPEEGLQLEWISQKSDISEIHEKIKNRAGLTPFYKSYLKKKEIELKPAAIFSSEMILQRDMPISIWGTAEPGEVITLTFAGQELKSKSDKTGKWSVTLKPMKAHAKGQNLQIKSANGKKVTLQNILIGDVWVCSGQSNMDFGIKMLKDGTKEMANADYPGIRLFVVQKALSAAPKDDLPDDCRWRVCTPESIAIGGLNIGGHGNTGFSGAAYYFGRELHKETGIPIGLIQSAWAGSRIEPWMPKEAFKSKALVDNLRHCRKPIRQRGQPEYQTYNAMIHPLTKLPIRGVIWYQGESNRGEGEIYFKKMEAMISTWRNKWNQGDFPFYYVQLAPHNYGRGWHAKLPITMEAQTKALSITNTGMAVINDIGNLKNIHPMNKQDVGRRLALWALSRTYNMPVKPYSGPLFKSAEIEDNRIRVYFNHTGSGLASRDGRPLNWFQIAGSDRRFVNATAEIDGHTVIVYSDQIKEPRYVRFAWNMTAVPNLMNKEGLPAGLFRTDK